MLTQKLGRSDVLPVVTYRSGSWSSSTGQHRPPAQPSGTGTGICLHINVLIKRGDESCKEETKEKVMNRLKRRHGVKGVPFKPDQSMDWAPVLGSFPSVGSFLFCS